MLEKVLLTVHKCTIATFRTVQCGHILKLWNVGKKCNYVNKKTGSGLHFYARMATKKVTWSPFSCTNKWEIISQGGERLHLLFPPEWCCHGNYSDFRHLWDFWFHTQLGTANRLYGWQDPLWINKQCTCVPGLALPFICCSFINCSVPHSTVTRVLSAFPGCYGWRAKTQLLRK